MSKVEISEFVFCEVDIIKVVLVGICGEMLMGLWVIMIKWVWFLVWLVIFFWIGCSLYSFLLVELLIVVIFVWLSFCIFFMVFVVLV